MSFCSKALGRELSVAPVGAALTFGHQRFTGLYVRDDVVDFRPTERALYAQHSGQHHHNIAVGQQQIPRGNIAVRNEALDCSSLLQISRASSRACRRSSTGGPVPLHRQHRSAADQPSVQCSDLHIREDIRDRAAILTSLRHHRRSTSRTFEASPRPFENASLYPTPQHKPADPRSGSGLTVTPPTSCPSNRADTAWPASCIAIR